MRMLVPICWGEQQRHQAASQSYSFAQYEKEILPGEQEQLGLDLAQPPLRAKLPDMPALRGAKGHRFLHLASPQSPGEKFLR